jgi:WD40 repeat protein
VADGGVVALAYAGADRLAVATDRGQVIMVDAATLEPVGVPVVLPEDVAGLAGFSDGRTVVALGAGSHQQVTWATEGRRWYRVDLRSGKVVQTGRLTMRQGLRLALAPDETRVAFGGADGEVEIVDLASGRSIRPAISDGAGDMHHLAFDASGERLVTGSNGRPMGLWDARTGLPLGASDLPEDVATHAVAFGPDGRVLAASIEGDVYAWDISAAATVRRACEVAGRDLTRQEWADAFGDVSYRRICR